MTTCEQFAARLEDYITGVLPPTRRAEMDAHAVACLACGTLLRDFEEAAALVWMAVPPVEPPAALRRRILTAARAAAPPIGVAAPAATAHPATGRRRWPLSLAQVAAAISALALAASLGLAGWALALQGEVDRQAAENQRLQAQLARQRDALYVLMSPTRVERPLAGGEAAPRARGAVYLDPTRRQGMVVATELPRPAPDRTYQVWLRGSGGVVSAGLLRFDERDTGYALLESPLPFDQFETIGISLEPAGGSPQPTGPRMMAGRL